MTHLSNEDRIKTLESYQILNTLPETEYDEIADLAANITETPISLISFLGSDRQFFKSRKGLDLIDTPLDISFCMVAIEKPEDIFIVEDANEDPRFKNNPFVSSDPNISFYAGVPLVTKNNIPLGTLCVLDTKPKKLNQNQIQALKILGNQVMQLLELRRAKAKAESHEKAYKNEAEQLKHILEGTRAGTWEWNIQTGQLTVNERWADIVGYALDELQPFDIQTWDRLLHPDDKDKVEKALADCFEKRTVFYDLELRMIHKMGHSVWVGSRGRVISWSADEKPIIMSGTHIEITDKKNIEIRFKNTINNLPGVIFRYMLYADGKNELQEISKKSKEIWGFHPDEIQMDNNLIWDRIDQRDLPALKKSIETSAATQSKWKCEYRYHHPEGELRWLKGTGNPTLGEDGHVLWDSLVVDITATKLAEIEASRLAEELDKILDRSIDMICTFDKDWKFVKVSNASKRILGYAPEKLEGKNYLDFIHPEDISKTLEASKSVENGKTLTNFENRYIKKGGNPVPIIWSAYHDINDRMTFCVARDATAIKQAEANLLLSEQRFKSLIQGGGDLIMILDIKGNYHYVSPTSKAIMGYSPEELIGNNVIDYIHPEDQKEFFIHFSKIKVNTKVEFKPMRCQHQDGTWRYVETTLTNMLDDPAVYGLVVNARDVTNRIIAEEKLRQSEEKYHKLFASGPMPKFIYELGTYEILDVNNSALKHYGFTYQELISHKLTELLEHSERKNFEASNNQAPEVGNTNFGIYSLKKKNKEKIKVDVTGHRIKLYDKECMVAIFIDVTDREKAFLSLQASEARYRGFYESSTNYVVLLNMHGQYTYVNEKFAQEFQWLYPETDIVGQDSLCSVMEYDLERLYQISEKCIKTPGKVYKIELDKPGREGAVLSTLWDFVCLVDEHGKPSEMQCVGIDITDRKKFERELIKSNERYENVTKATNDAVWDWDLTTNQVFRTGDGFTNLFGYSNQEAGADNYFWRKRVDPEQLNEVINSQVQVLKDPTKNYWESEYRFLRKDGRYAYVYDRGYIVRNQDGIPLRMIGATQDITYRKEYEASLKELNKELAKHSRDLEISNAELEQFAYVASHDLQEPLRMVTNFLTLLDRKYGDKLDDKAKTYIQFAVDGASRMRQIILDLLEFSRLSQAQETKENIEINQLLEDYQILRQRLINEKSAKIIIDWMPLIHSYKVPVTQVFHNLLDNALKYTKKDVPPVIRISAQDQEGKWLFTIEDNGIGIEKDYFDKIFIIFQRLHSHQEYSGTGMGLAIVKKIIDNLNGKIWLESKAGEGTKFYFTIKK